MTRHRVSIRLFLPSPKFLSSLRCFNLSQPTISSECSVSQWVYFSPVLSWNILCNTVDNLSEPASFFAKFEFKILAKSFPIEYKATTVFWTFRSPPTPHDWRIFFSGSAFRPSLQTAPPMPRTGGLLWPLSWLSWALADTGCQCPCQWCPERVPRVISRPSWPPLSPTTILSTLIKPPPRRPLPRMSNRTDPSDTEPSELYGESFVVCIRSGEILSEEPSWRNSSKMVCRC